MTTKPPKMLIKYMIYRVNIFWRGLFLRLRDGMARPFAVSTGVAAAVHQGLRVNTDRGNFPTPPPAYIAAQHGMHPKMPLIPLLHFRNVRGKGGLKFRDLFAVLRAQPHDHF